MNLRSGICKSIHTNRSKRTSIEEYQGHGVKILKEKYKAKGFAAGCSREVIARGAEQLGWELSKLLEMTLQAMAASEDTINAEMAAIEAQK